MKLLLNNIFEKQKKIFIVLAIIIAIFGIIFVINRFYVKEVSAQIIPVVVNVEHLAFGTVFPGENLEGNFIVTYAETGDGVNYRLIQRPKELPPDYPGDGDPENPGYYRNLCPFLTKVSIETEGDTEDLAFVGPDDLSDTWVIYFEVPAIFGHVAQDHTGGVISEGGDYGCDISVDILEQ